MIRHAAALAVVVCLSPAWLSAQSTTLTVSAVSADVHKSPSTGSPVIGTARRGTVLTVTRELGSWVKVSWPEAQDGAAYVHVSMLGATTSRSTAVPTGTAQSSPRTAPAASPAPTTNAHTEVEQINQRLTSSRPVPEASGTPVTHALGLGGLMGSSPLGFGASLRAWRRNRMGVQVEISRYAMSSVIVPDRVTSTQVEPAFLYALPDRVSDYVWMRPYVGTGVHLRRQRLSSDVPGAAFAVSETAFGTRAFGGGEWSFSGMSQFALSTEIGYRWTRNPVAGFDADGLGLVLAGHWYLR